MADQADTPLILDTHSFIWLLEGAANLDGSGFVSQAERASAAGELYLCSISLAEVAFLARTERLKLVIPVSTWLSEALQTPGLQLVGIDPALASEGARLPGEFPGDAADRLIVAAARLLGGMLATADPLLLDYGAAGHVRVIDVSRS